MKLLIALPKIFGGKNARRHPHFFTAAHLQKIKKAGGGRVSAAVAYDARSAAAHARDADIIAGFPMTIPPLGDAINLKWAHSFSAGVDRVLTRELMRSPALISNSSGIHATPIAEHIIGFMLLFTRGFHRAARNQARRIWKKDETVGELRGKTVFIAGLGDIGREAGRLAHAFGCRVIATARSKKQKPRFVDELKTSASLDAMLPRADFVVICLPHTIETHHLFDISKFRKMKPRAVLINIGRGGIVRESDLITALRKKIIAGAALDVTEKEPLPRQSPLWGMDNVIITAHYSGLSEKYMDRAVDLFCKNLKRFLAGKPLLTLVDKKRGY